MLAAPLLLLLIAAHFTNLLQGGSAYPTLFAAWLVGATAVILSGWSPMVKLITSLIYVALAYMTLPFLGLLAVCSTGNCI